MGDDCERDRGDEQAVFFEVKGNSGLGGRAWDGRIGVLAFAWLNKDVLQGCNKMNMTLTTLDDDDWV